MSQGSLSTVERLFWLMTLVGHLMACVIVIVLAPGGFPWAHPRFWMNRVLPSLGLIGCFLTLLSLHRENLRQLLILLPALPAAWLGAAITSRVVFPITFAWIWLVPLGVAVVMAAFLISIAQRATTTPSLALLALSCTGAAIGVATVLGERPPPPGAHPYQEDWTVAETSDAPTLTVNPPTIDLGTQARVYTSEGSLNVRLAPLTLTITPLLRFLSRSPDGCWTILSRPEEREGPEPKFRGATRRGDRRWFLDYDFRGQGRAILQLFHEPARGTIALEAVSRLDRPVYSHLNSFCDIEVRGHRRLSLRFSPCGDSQFEVLPFDYPFGRPSRFAYVDEARQFRVVEASNGEKGPFHVLAEGRLDPDQPLEITFRDEDRSVGQVRLLDWSAQVSTQLSPAAGWGVPENAIEFSLSDDEPNAPANLFITLAGTSVGRGWDSIGHAAGTYRNRIEIEPSSPDKP
jgi:hypothetical protein